MNSPVGAVADEFYHLKVQLARFSPGTQRRAEALRLRVRGDIKNQTNQTDKTSACLVHLQQRWSRLDSGIHFHVLTESSVSGVSAIPLSQLVS